MRGTIHVLTPDDALALRPWVQPALDQQSSGNQMSRPARDVPADDLVAACRRLLADGPLPVKRLGERLAEDFPDVPAAALAHKARERAPLVQVPPRGLWRRSGGVVYQTVENHLGRATTEVDVPALVRRYLRAFGPATAADMTTWSRVTRLGPVFAAMRDELVPVACEDGRTRYDVPGAPYAAGTRPAPVRLLGGYDNVWLSHADRGHIVPSDVRGRGRAATAASATPSSSTASWPGCGGTATAASSCELFRDLTRAERADLDVEVARTEAFLAR